tara:strand:+ start:276 stop:722 length:447 start_codon:yes stop_codon:yes gene_type:complete
LKEKFQEWLNQVGRKEIMSLNDPIGDMLARIKNSLLRNHKKVELPSSNFKIKIAEVLKNEGYINNYEVSSQENKFTLEIELKYNYGSPVISSIQRVSKPGRRIFSSAESLPKINNGLGIAIVSTPKGVMTDIDARKQKIGGEIICKVF